MARSSSKAYFGLPRLISIILAIIPVTSWLCGIITRFQQGRIVAGILRIFFGWNIVWLLDLIIMIFKGDILTLLKC